MLFPAERREFHAVAHGELGAFRPDGPHGAFGRAPIARHFRHDYRAGHRRRIITLDEHLVAERTNRAHGYFVAPHFPPEANFLPVGWPAFTFPMPPPVALAFLPVAYFMVRPLVPATWVRAV